MTVGSVMNASTRTASPQRGHWVTSSPKTLSNSAAESSLRASLIEAGIAVILLAGPRRSGERGTTRERQAWCGDRYRTVTVTV